MKEMLIVIALSCITAFAQDQIAAEYPLELSIKSSSPGSMTFSDGSSDYTVSCRDTPPMPFVFFPGGGFYALHWAHVANKKDSCRDYPAGMQFRARLSDNVLNGIAVGSTGTRAFSYKLISKNDNVEGTSIRTSPEETSKGEAQNASASDLGATIKTSKESGVEIVGLLPRSSLQAAGLHVGDIIKTVNGQSVRTPEEFQKATEKSAGTTVKISYQYLESKMWWVQKDISIGLAK